MPKNCVTEVPILETSGIWMRCLSRSKVSSTTYGRAVDQRGKILGVLVQSRRDKKAAQKFLHKLLKDLEYVPRVIITDQLASYAAARRELLPGVEHRQQKRLNNRAENSHQPTRQRERTMRRFKSPGHTQRFLSADRAHFLAFSTATAYPSSCELSTGNEATLCDLGRGHWSSISGLVRCADETEVFAEFSISPFIKKNVHLKIS